jgi:hypothetical protein
MLSKEKRNWRKLHGLKVNINTKYDRSTIILIKRTSILHIKIIKIMSTFRSLFNFFNLQLNFIKMLTLQLLCTAL